MKIYVIGGLGFIGHHVAAKLQSLGHECVIIDNHENYGILSRKELYDLYMERRALIGNVNEKYHDIRTPLDLSGADVVVHLASYPRAKAVDLNLAKAAEVMLAGTVKLCEAANKNNSKMIFISSSMVYGDWKSEYVYEDQLCNPKSLYGIMKLQGEQLTKAICPNNYVIIRPSAVYGPRDVTDRVVSLMFKAARNNQPIRVEGADNLLDFTYVDDLVDGIVSTVLSNTVCTTVNMSSSQPRSLGELAQLIKNVTNTSSEIIFAEHNARYPKRGGQNIDVARKLYNFNPTTTLEEGLEKTYNWIKNRK